MIHECTIVTRWLEEIVEEAYRNSASKYVKSYTHDNGDYNHTDENDYKAKIKRNSSAKSDEDEINEEKLKLIFKDFNVK